MIPGFNAEILLHQRSRSYSMANSPIEIVNLASLSRAVKPAFLTAHRATDFCTACEDAG
jgi:hypothetical protein